MKTRAQYLAGECSHREYYAQFVTPEIRKQVLARFPLKRLCQTSDQEHLNSIPLSGWDGLAYSMEGIAAPLRLADDFPTLCSRVCILKEAAKQLIEETPKGSFCGGATMNVQLERPAWMDRAGPSMKSAQLSFAEFVTFKRAPNDQYDLSRSAYRAMNGFDMIIQEWPSRAAMLKTCDMQSRRAFRQTDWKPFQP